MATQFELFIQTELPKRPSVALDPAQETILVRRGAGPRVYEEVPINEGEVLGKLNGTVQSVTNSSAVASSVTTISPQTTLTISSFPSVNFKSKKLVVEIDQGGLLETFEMLALKVPGGVDYTTYGHIGIDTLSNITTIDNGTDVIVEMANNNVVDNLIVAIYAIT